MNRCYWCNEPRHRSDLRILDDKFFCHPDLTNCKKEYEHDTLPGINIDRAQIRALGSTSF